MLDKEKKIALPLHSRSEREQRSQEDESRVNAVEVEKKTSKYFQEKFGCKEKMITFAPRSGRQIEK